MVYPISNNLVIKNQLLFQNQLINGNLDVWQRGTSVALADVTVKFLSDRWRDYVDKNGGTLPTLTRSRETLTPGEIPNSYFFTRLTTNGAGSSLGVNSYHSYIEKIENGTRYLCGAGKKVTKSFWARSSIANKRIIPFLVQSYGTGGSPSADEIITGNPITLTSNWTRYTVTFTTNTLAGKTFGTNNDDNLQASFWLMWGDTIGDLVGATGIETYVGAGTIDIAQVRLYPGEFTDLTIPQFIPLSYVDELRACQRYWRQSYNEGVVAGTATGVGRVETSWGNGSAAGTIFGITMPLPVPMRIDPTATIYDMAGNSARFTKLDGGAAETNNQTINSTIALKNSLAVRGFNISGVVGYSFQYTLSAELQELFMAATSIKPKQIDLTSQLKCSIYSSAANQVIPNTTWTVFAFNAETFDTGGLHDNVTNNSRITIPAGGGGLYLVGYTIAFNTNATGFRASQIKKNNVTAYFGNSLAAANGNTTGLVGSVLLSLSAGDYLELFSYQNSGGNLDVWSQENNTNFWAIKLN